LGGWLAETVDWRAVFLINVPIAAVVLVASVRVPESRDEEREPGLDMAGAVTVTLGLGGVVFALVEGPLRGGSDPLVAGAGVLGALLLAIFLRIQQRRRDPMVPLGLFRQRTFATANAVTLFVYAALAGNLFFLPLNLIQVQGYSATAAGASLLPFILVLTLFSRATGALADRVGPRKPMAFGSALTGLGFLLLAVPGIGGSYWTTFFPGILVLGIGMTFVVSPLTTAVMGSVKVRFSGIASGINNAVSRTAGLLAVAALGALAVVVFTSQLAAGLEDAGLDEEEQDAVMAERGRLAALQPPDSLDEQEQEAVRRAAASAFVDAFRAISVVSGALCLLGAALAWVGVEPKDEFQAPA
jgi:MFS family permease